uniref:RxLR effector candidate protein n=1 Tax=Hyaloperonospora arabidopsidis (strain Emoy2) TaxID=559515 RepID=M4BQP3_HYAAE
MTQEVTFVAFLLLCYVDNSDGRSVRKQLRHKRGARHKYGRVRSYGAGAMSRSDLHVLLPLLLLACMCDK